MNVQFKVIDRKGKKSLWVNNYNIWDLEESELTENVMSAIMSAFDRAILIHKQELQQLDLNIQKKFERYDL